MSHLVAILGWYGAQQAGWVHADLVNLAMACVLLTVSLGDSTVLTLGAVVPEEFSYPRYRRMGEMLRRGWEAR